MKEEIVSSKLHISNGNDPSLPKLPLSPPTPAASSVGASSPAAPANDGSLQQRTTSLNELSNLSCRPWERGDLLRRLSTFKLAGKAKVAGSLACAKRGWVSIDDDKIECEICGSTLDFTSSASSINFADASSEELSEQLDRGHKVTCPWSGNSCPESLVHFPPTSPSALIGGFKDRCDALLQFYSLPVVSSSAVDQIRLTHGPQIDRFLAQLQIQAAGDMGYRAESVSAIGYSGEQSLHSYTYAQKLISLCGWEARWLPNVLDCEEQSAESAKNDYSSDPAKGSAQYPTPSRKEFSATSRKDTGGSEILGSEFNCESRTPLLDCSLCGTTVRVWDFLTVHRPVHLAPCSADTPQMSKKVTSTRGVSATSGINEWVVADGVEKECTDDHDEAATPDKRQLVSDNLKETEGLSCSRVNLNLATGQLPGPGEGRSSMVGRPSGSVASDQVASYESQGPNARKRQLDGGGSTVDRPHLHWQQANSAEGIIVDCGNNEATDGQLYPAGPSKRARGPNLSEKIQLSCRRDSFGAVPSHSLDTQIEADASTGNRFDPDRDNVVGIPSTRESTHASSIIAMDTIHHSSDDESMESVDNFRQDATDISFNSAGLNETSELNNSYQAQNSFWSQPILERAGADAGVSSSNAFGEVLNTDTLTAPARDGPSFGVSGGSVGMGASHEAEIHGTDISVHRGDSLGDVEPDVEVIEHQGQAGEYVPRGQTGNFVPEEMILEDPQGDSQAVVSQSAARTDSGSKIISTKVESVESDEKTCSMQMLGNENGAHPSLSCNAIVFSAYEASKEEVTQTGKGSPIDDGAYIESGCLVADDMGTPYRDKSNGCVEFDPIKQHDEYCPWVNRDVTAAGCAGHSSISDVDAVALCGWQLTLDALDSFLSLGHVPVQPVESESAASLCKGDRLAPSQKLLASNSFVRSRGKN